MASTIPEQYRAVDPFASYNSNTVNQLTEMTSRNENVLDIPCGLDVVLDETSSSSVVVRPGYAFKDDVMIYVSEDHTVDFSDDDQYIVTPTVGLPLQTGWHYVVLEYTFIKSRPAPQANIKIVRTDDRNSYDYGSSSTSLIFLKAVNITSVGPPVVGSISDYDPENVDNKRTYAKRYAGPESNFIPAAHAQCRDQGRFAYDTTKDEFWFGYEDRWERLNVAGTFTIDTENVTVGDLCYVDSNRQAALADATSIVTAAEMVVVEVGLAADGTGQARLNGYVQNVNVEAGSAGVVVGDLLYLSNSEPGTVTSTQTSPLYQVVGRALTAESASKVDILFSGRALQETNTAPRVARTIDDVDVSWVPSGGSQYGQIDITDLGLTTNPRHVTVTCWDVATIMVISPQDIEANSDTTIRVWMPDTSVEVRVAIVG